MKENNNEKATSALVVLPSLPERLLCESESMRVEMNGRRVEKVRKLPISEWLSHLTVCFICFSGYFRFGEFDVQTWLVFYKSVTVFENVSLLHFYDQGSDVNSC